MKWYKRIWNDEENRIRMVAGAAAICLIAMAVTSELMLSSINKKMTNFENNTMDAGQVADVITDAFDTFQQHNPSAPVPEIIEPPLISKKQEYREPVIKIKPAKETPIPSVAAKPEPSPTPITIYRTRTRTRILMKKRPTPKPFRDWFKSTR